MPYLQAPAVNAPFGFQPAENGWCLPTIGQYVVSTSFGSQVFVGDMMCMTSSSGFVTVYTSGAATPIGAAAEGCPASLTSATRIAVYNAPDQVYVVQQSTASTVTGIGLGIGIVTSASGSTVTGRSKQMCGVVAPTVSTTNPLRVVGVHPIEGIDGTTGVPANAKLLVRLAVQPYAGMPVTT